MSLSGWAGQKADGGILDRNAYFMRDAVKGMTRIHVRSWGIGIFRMAFCVLGRLADDLNRPRCWRRLVLKHVIKSLCYVLRTA